MQVVIDPSAILAVLLDEPQREAVIAASGAAILLAPGSAPWEVGNALIAGLRRRRLTLAAVEAAWRSFEAIPLRLIDIDVPRALKLAAEHGLYAYDAYVLEAALGRRLPLLSLDQQLLRAAEQAGITLLEI